MKNKAEIDEILKSLGFKAVEKEPNISIGSMIEDINEKYNFCFESEQFRKMNDAFLEKLNSTLKDAELSENLFDEHMNGVIKAEQDYFKAGFCAGVKLLLESLRMNI